MRFEPFTMWPDVTSKRRSGLKKSASKCYNLRFVAARFGLYRLSSEPNRGSGRGLKRCKTSSPVTNREPFTTGKVSRAGKMAKFRNEPVTSVQAHVRQFQVQCARKESSGGS